MEPPEDGQTKIQLEKVGGLISMLMYRQTQLTTWIGLDYSNTQGRVDLRRVNYLFLNSNTSGCRVNFLVRSPRPGSTIRMIHITTPLGGHCLITSMVIT